MERHPTEDGASLRLKLLAEMSDVEGREIARRLHLSRAAVSLAMTGHTHPRVEHFRTVHQIALERLDGAK